MVKAASAPLLATVAGKKESVYAEKAPGEKTDVQVEAARPKVTVSVNGKATQFDALTTETQKFERGKLVITEETQLRLDVKVPPPPRCSLGIGWGKNGPAFMAGGRLGGVPAGRWLFGDRRTLAGGIAAPLGR